DTTLAILEAMLDMFQVALDFVGGFDYLIGVVNNAGSKKDNQLRARLGVAFGAEGRADARDAVQKRHAGRTAQIRFGDDAPDGDGIAVLHRKLRLKGTILIAGRLDSAAGGRLLRRAAVLV